MPYNEMAEPFHKKNMATAMVTGFSCFCGTFFANDALFAQHVEQMKYTENRFLICKLCKSVVPSFDQMDHDRFHKIYGWHGYMCIALWGGECNCGLAEIPDAKKPLM